MSASTLHQGPAVSAFEWAYGAKLPATAKITDDVEVLLTFHDYPHEHMVHLRNTSLVESMRYILRNSSKQSRVIS